MALAARNLALLTVDGLDRRIAELERLLAEYGKPSHAEALASAARLRAHLFPPGARPPAPVETALFRADAADGAALRAGLAGRQVDVVLTDVPYGRRAHWTGAARDAGDDLADGADDYAAARYGSAGREAAANDPAGSPLAQMLEALLAVIAPDTLVAVAPTKCSASLTPPTGP